MVPVTSYFVRIDLYNEGIGGVVDVPDMTADERRTVSEQLFAFARHIRDEVWSETNDPDDRQLSVTRIYGSGRVNCWTSNDITTAEQSDWIATRFQEAAQASRHDA